jgi:hypothetical protein
MGEGIKKAILTKIKLRPIKIKIETKEIIPPNSYK